MTLSPKKIPIRVKIVLIFFFSFLLILVFNLSYFPRMYKNQKMKNLENHVTAMTEMIALSTGVSLELRDFASIGIAVEWAKKDSRLVYLGIFDTENNKVATYNPNQLKLNIEGMLNRESVVEQGRFLFKAHDIVYQENWHGKILIGFSLDELNRNIEKDWEATFTISLAIFSLGILIVFILGRKITQPLSELTQAANEIYHGKNDVPIEVRSNDEVGELAGTLKTMLDRINDSMEEIKNINAEMEKTRDDALEANRAKSEFLSRMSHELRTPMNAILGFGQLLEADPEEPLTPGQTERIQEILKAGKHLLELINEVLDLAKIESGKLVLSIENIELEDLILETLVLTSHMAEKHKITIHNRAAQHPALQVVADRTRLKQVLLNLISNAIKYNRENGDCTLELEETQSGNVRIKVMDRGPGIPKEKMDSLFKPFDRLGAENTEIEGTGIGLSICKHLIELMHGTISVESVPDKGSCFTIELPKGSQQSLPKEKLATLAAQKSGAESNGNKHTILYVEDNPANLNLVKQILHKEPDITLLTAPQARLGIELALAHQPNLILMDIHLPGMDGISALKHLKKHDETRGIPVIAVSANAMESDIEKTMRAGFDAYVTKPLQVKPFLEKVRHFLVPREKVGGSG